MNESSTGQLVKDELKRGPCTQDIVVVSATRSLDVSLIDGVDLGLATTAVHTASVYPSMLLALLAVQSPLRLLPLADLRLATATHMKLLKNATLPTVRAFTKIAAFLHYCTLSMFLLDWRLV
jgi:hypothetical protein